MSKPVKGGFRKIQEGYIKKGGTNTVPNIPRPPAPKGQGPKKENPQQQEKKKP